MAVGPTAMRFVYYFTKDGAFLGPGSMFVLASGLYLLAVYCAYLLPVCLFIALFIVVDTFPVSCERFVSLKAEADSRSRHPQGYENARDDQHQSNVETPLLNQTNR